MQRTMLILFIVFLGIYSRDASAFWGSSNAQTPSGLNVDSGFDVNTVTTVHGVVIAPPGRTGPQAPAVLSMATTQGAVQVVLGPWWYWEQLNITIANTQEIAVTGSRAQGKDGSFYIFAQQIENRSSGSTITLRSASGVPLWSHGNGASGRRPGGGLPTRSGGRGSGMRGGRR